MRMRFHKDADRPGCGSALFGGGGALPGGGWL